MAVIFGGFMNLFQRASAGFPINDGRGLTALILTAAKVNSIPVWCTGTGCGLSEAMFTCR
jgi:hypothetical protein